jgi:hypothetical protein
MSDLRAALETSFNEAEKEETAPIAAAPETSAPPAETEQQSEPVAAPESNASDPVAPSPSSEGKEGSEATSDIKSIEEVVGDALDKAEPNAPEPPSSSPPPPGNIDQAPASWKGDAKQLWKELPIAARQEVMRRERDTLKVLQDTALDRRKVQEITQVIQPHMERIAANYEGNPLVAINNLLQADRVLSSGTPLNKAQMVANIIQNFGIDLVTLDNLLSGQPLPAEVQQRSEVERLVEERLRPVMDFVGQQQARQQQVVQQTQAQIAETVEIMAADTTKYPYFEDVRMDMADIIEMHTKRGVDLSLEEAYNRAVRMNGHTAAAVETRQSTQAATQTALQAHQEAQRAKGAAVSIAGSPSTTSGPTVDPTDLRSLISSQLDNKGARI